MGDRAAAGRRSSPPAPARAHGRRARSSRSATRSSRSFRSRTRRRANSRDARLFPKRHMDSGAGFRTGQLEHSFRSGESVLDAVDLVFEDIGPSVTSDSAGGHSAAHRAARCAAGRGRDLGHDQAGEARADRRLGRALRHGERDQPARAAGAPHRPHRAAADRCARAGRSRPPAGALRRRHGAGAPARLAVRGDHSRAEERTASRSPAPIGWC